ncbi:MAG: hypothetical protein DIZ80_03040 [endosymbiont of Galathealinum brachiosum]|uniref:Catalase n=1 Tax=endosymbiont of Galathealinum brachiosum TaxID=2200906 RepID=A0A370DIU2_9GAMM|nr:MAG: hypothetical protein DIZ80_03040 [endosymbiont of Galathealinum brachiosum]
MIVNSSQNIQSSNPVGTSSSRRVNDVTRSSNLNSEDKEAEKVQKQQDDNLLRQLRARDREVRAHEAAHVAAGGSLVRGGPSFTFQAGPDGRTYAIGGEVRLDVSPVANDPQATLSKADQIRAAALAPANPSPQDLRVAANANQLASRARVDLAIQRREEAKLEENEQAIESVSSSTNEKAVDTVPAVESSSPAVSSAESANLQSSEPPAAAISNFMATAQTEPAPVLLNQFA